MKPLAECSVLVVEDDFTVGLELMRALSDVGCAVRLVRTVEGALQELSATPPDVATLDICMRGKASTPVADALADRGVPFVIVSGKPRDALPARHCRHAICRKPVAAHDVVSLLSAAVGQRNAA